jgi:hypothetical protein
MKKAIEIKSEIDKTQSRIAELEMERERQTVAVVACIYKRFNLHSSPFPA